MYKKRKNYKSLMSKVRSKGKWHFNPMVKSNDAKYFPLFVKPHFHTAIARSRDTQYLKLRCAMVFISL